MQTSRASPGLTASVRSDIILTRRAVTRNNVFSVNVCSWKSRNTILGAPRHFPAARVEATSELEDGQIEGVRMSSLRTDSEFHESSFIPLTSNWC